jgi:hypothetical protein
LAAILERNAARTCILQDPVMAYYSTKIAPMKVILDEVFLGHITSFSALSLVVILLNYVGGPVCILDKELNSVSFIYSGEESIGK